MQEFDKIRTEFFANLSHEVRTPINIIYSCIQLLDKEKEYGSDKIAEFYFKYEKTIRQNCLRILRLINNIIDVSRYECGGIKTNFKMSSETFRAHFCLYLLKYFINYRNLSGLFILYFILMICYN